MHQLLERGVDRDKISAAFQEVVYSSGESLAAELNRRAPKMLREHRRLQRQFERRLRKHWREGLDRYYATFVTAREAGDVFNTRERPEAGRTSNYKFEALTRLHARACVTASEVYALMRTGHATGAHARARTLHEIAVVSFVIGEADNDTAERYLLHERIQNARDAEDYQHHCGALGQDPLEQDVLDEIRRDRDALVTRYGSDYKKDNGWAVHLFGRRPTFRDLEERAKLDIHRPYYQWFSHGVHAGSKGAALNVSTSAGGRYMLAGPSNDGLADPAHAALISLEQATVALLIYGTPEEPEPEDLFALIAISRLTTEAGDAFLEAHKRMERLKDSVSTGESPWYRSIIERIKAASAEKDGQPST